MEKSALILIDLQNDFLPGGALAVARGDEVLAVANRLSSQFDLVVATQDWHPSNHMSFAANHPGRHVGEKIDLDGLPQVLWPVHCVQETRGAEFASELNQTRIHKIFRKGEDPNIDSYSGFFDNGHRRATGMHEYLIEQQVTQLCVLGLATDYCVKFTALDARRLGWSTTVYVDGCRAVNLSPHDDAAAIAQMRQAGVRCCESR
jgi:nicotinamidase/pyrazinamidase